jgi:hypothetical protein
LFIFTIVLLSDDGKFTKIEVKSNILYCSPNSYCVDRIDFQNIALAAITSKYFELELTKYLWAVSTWYRVKERAWGSVVVKALRY